MSKNNLKIKRYHNRVNIPSKNISGIFLAEKIDGLTHAIEDLTASIDGNAEMAHNVQD